MSLWRFLDYVTEENENLIRIWYEGQDDAVRGAFDGALSILAATRDWTEIKFKTFKQFADGDDYFGLSEIRFYIVDAGRKRKFRPLGIWKPDANELILILGCEKSGRVKIPPDAFDLAMQYKGEFEQGRGRVDEHF